MQIPSPTSVTLKMNKTSVMLYANEYLSLPDGRGASSQVYIASFPKTATDIPPAFEQQLREATVGRPERYFALRQRIESEVLIPARIFHRQKEAARQRRELTSALQHVTRGLKDIPEMPGYPAHSSSAEFQSLLPDLKAGADRLLPLPHRQDITSVEPLEPPEQRLKRLLSAVNAACAEIAELMPEASQAFRRGHRFTAETQNEVHQLWFRTSDVVAALSARTQLRRPRNWSRLRERVMGGERGNKNS